MSEYVKIVGQDKVMSHLKKLADPNKTLNRAIKDTAMNSLRELVKETQTKQPRSKSFKYGDITVNAKNLSTGDTARAWTKPTPITDGYEVSNAKKSGKYNIARLIDEGHGEIRPSRKELLYIPISRKGQSKRAGAKGDGKVGEDFIFVKKVKARKGSGFLAKEKRRASIELTKRVINGIREVFKT